MDSNPPFLDQYGALLHNSSEFRESLLNHKGDSTVGECQLPLIDLMNLTSGDERERRVCVGEIAKAASEWGFFQVLNHGISHELLEDMRREQVKVFEMPFEKKLGCSLLNDSYRWGAPTATSLKEFSWSEAFHIPISKISEEGCCDGEFNSTREVMEKFAAAMSTLARSLAGVLVENLSQSKQFFEDNCNERTCFLRLNRYPSCSLSPDIFGLVPHTDSDFLTILCQDQVGGLQLMKDSKWVAVKPNPDALIVNIGDLFQAWSNNIYRSVEHKVMVNPKVERYSIAYFLCPSYDSMIGSCKETSLYKNFTFGQFRQQVQQDVKMFGIKVGLPRFLL
ncbi:gibberellin 2-beta-dioxygenase 6-like [Tasmannia lanceolata]|uniref:gibberellin 2-beta-dioxygenase 6-like n=1 Tax=Tasmannia lanceolata TaxID=3420 RepID=UPI004063F693